MPHSDQLLNNVNSLGSIVTTSPVVPNSAGGIENHIFPGGLTSSSTGSASDLGIVQGNSSDYGPYGSYPNWFDYDGYYDFFKNSAQADHDWAHNEAELNREWQERMSNTAYQRMVQDLQAAGLNPWLALQGAGLGGASTGSGGVASSGSSYLEMSEKFEDHLPKIINSLTSILDSSTGALTDVIKAVTGSVNSGMKIVGTIAAIIAACA